MRTIKLYIAHIKAHPTDKTVPYFPLRKRSIHPYLRSFDQFLQTAVNVFTEMIREVGVDSKHRPDVLVGQQSKSNKNKAFTFCQMLLCSFESNFLNQIFPEFLNDGTQDIL